MNFGPSEWLEWQNPWWLLLVIPLLAGLFWRSHNHYLKKAHSSFAPLYIGFGAWLKLAFTRFRFAFPSVLKFFALLAIIAALVDVTRAYIFVEELLAMHRFPVLIDNSSSMYGFNWGRRHNSISCSTSGRFYPRIHGACQALYRLLDEVEVHTKKKAGQSQDLIGLIQFANRSYVTSYLTNDYRGLREKIDRMEFNSENILGVATEMHLGIWDMYLMALDRNLQGDAGFTHLTGQDLRDLVRSLAPGDPSSLLTLSKELEKKLLKTREEMRDTVFIVITDAVVSYLTPRVESATPFFYKKADAVSGLSGTPCLFSFHRRVLSGTQEIGETYWFRSS